MINDPQRAEIIIPPKHDFVVLYYMSYMSSFNVKYAQHDKKYNVLARANTCKPTYVMIM